METKTTCPSCKRAMVSGTQDDKQVYACLHCNKIVGMVTTQFWGNTSVSTSKKRPGEQLLAKSSLDAVRTPQKQEKACLQVELPLPPRELSPNASRPGNWWIKSKAAKEYRATCGMLLWQAREKDGSILFPNGCILTYEWYCGGNRKGDGLLRIRDEDNSLLAAKRIQDSLVDAKYVCDDSAKFVSIKEVKLYRKKEEHQGRCCIVLTIEAKES
jgi:hypothetical protein